MTLSVHDITDFLGDNVLTVHGNPKVYPITRPMPLDSATRGAITFCRGALPNGKERVLASQSEVIIVPNETWVKTIIGKWLIVVDDPYACFIRVMQRYFDQRPPNSIHPTAHIDTGVILGSHVYVGANAVIQHAVIGDNVTIQPGAVIGCDGFGFAHDNRTEDGALIRFPHVGNVIIEDDVEIGANAVIDRGTLGSTFIRKGVKIDNLVHVAHNADIGEHTALVAHSMIGGSVTIGAGSWIAPHAAIRDRRTLGKNVLVGLGAVVVKNVDDDETVIGVPAKAMERT